MHRLVSIALCLLAASAAAAPSRLPPAVAEFVAAEAPVVALTHLRVIDGTGAPPRDDQTIVFADGVIRQLGPSASIRPPRGALVLDEHGRTAIPGIVGMHDHLFYAQYTDHMLLHDIPISATRLYLASGVTTIRTAGSINPYLDLGVKRRVDDGQMVGPKIHVTGPYLQGRGAFTPQMPELTSVEQVTRTVEFWADEGVTSFKVYSNLPAALASAAISAAHRRRLKVTAHLCSLTFADAIALGIDNLEHGLPTSSDFDEGKAADVCPDFQRHLATVAALDVASAPVQALIANLVAHKVALTSTLAVYESHLPGRAAQLRGRVAEALAPEALADALSSQLWVDEPDESFQWYRQWVPVFRNEAQFERAFVRAGGLLIAGADPTGDGGVLPGFGDQREIELLVDAGFTPLEAIHVATANGAAFLDEADRIGTIAVGKRADLDVVRGNPATRIRDIENTEVVFKDGVGFDSAKLIRSVRARVGVR
jgi:imidazolonepropionase-like amidohydrolase